MPLCLAPLTALLRPAWTARRYAPRIGDPWSRWVGAYAIYLLAVAMFWTAATVLGEASRFGSFDVARWWETLISPLTEAAGAMENWLFGPMVVAAVLGALVLGPAVLVSPFAAWGAGVSAQESHKHTLPLCLGRLCVSSPHAVTILVTTFFFMEAIDALPRRHDGEFWYFLLIAAAWLWSLLYVLAVVAAPSTGGEAHCRWPAGCERCGYPLTGLRDPKAAAGGGASSAVVAEERDQRSRLCGGAACPECGTPVAASAHLDLRPGSPWDRDPSFRTWCITAWLAITRPTHLGRMLPLLRPAPARRWFLLPTLVGLLVLGLLGGCLVVLANGLALVMNLDAGAWYYGGWWHPSRILMLFAISVSVTVPATSLLWFAAASVLGSLRSRFTGRNLLPAANAGSCYLGGYLLLWSVANWVWITLYAFVGRLGLLDDLYPTFGIEGGEFVMAVVLLVNAPLWLGYLLLLQRIMNEMRHANV